MGKNIKNQIYLSYKTLQFKSRLISNVIRTLFDIKRLVFSLRLKPSMGFELLRFLFILNMPFRFFDKLIYLTKRRMAFGVIINHIAEHFSPAILMNNNLAICNMPSFNRAFNGNLIFNTHTYLPQGRIYSLKGESNNEIL